MDPYLYLEEITKQLDANIERIHFLCTKLPYRGVNWTYYHTNKSIMVEWMRQGVIVFEQQEQSGEFYQKYRDLYKGEKKSAEAILRFENLFHKSVFKCNYTDNFVASFSQPNFQKQRVIFSYMNYIAQGYFRKIPDVFEVFEVPHSGQELEKMYAAKVLQNKYLIFLVTIQQTPVQSNNRTLVKMDFTQVIVFLDLVTPAQADQLKNKTHPKIYNKVIADYIKEPGYILNQKMLNPYKTNENNLFQFNNVSYYYNYGPVEAEPGKFVTGNPFFEDIVPYSPNKFFVHKFLNNDKDTYYYDARKQRWTLQNQDFLKDLQSIKEYQEQVSNYVISQCLNFGSASKLVDVLQRIPNFKVKLSNEQSHIISCSGNVVCIGRSGTGKTTSAVLRMFALEMLFKYRLSVYHQRHSKSLQKTRFNPKDIDKNVGLRCIFVTASPVLTNEIKRYYDRLTKQLKEELVKRDEKIQADQLEKQIQLRKQKEKELKKESQEQQTEQDEEYDAEKEEVELLMEQQFENLQLKKEISNDETPVVENKTEEGQKEKEEKITFDDDDAEKLQKDMDKFENLQTMSPTDFPAFMTVRNLIMLIDASLSYPFFKRNKEGKIRGQTAQNTWHNEQKGTLYINNYHKNNMKVGDIKDEGFPNMENRKEDEEESDDELETQNLNEFQIGEKFRQTIRNQEKKINQITAQKVKQINQAKKMAYEVDFEYFKRFFWKRIQNRVIGFKTLDVHFVWTEIYSIIKGSTQSCYYWGGHTYGLSKYMYNQQQTRLTSHEVDRLYDIYNEYEVWKNNEGCYDFMDIINYIIRAMNYGYNKNLQYLHYIMVDEVQDLPMNILYLMKKITTNGIFYSGDTAQTIAQGVGFRYGSLKSLFQGQKDTTSYSGQPVDSSTVTDNVTIQQLTINFRSHNRILYLANSVIDLLEFFFPETIDRLKKEKSQIDGPKPIILGESDPELLFCILTGESNVKSDRHSSNQGAMGRNPIEFGCSQVVLVRNQESKKKLPPMLSHALCLTIYEAKGLEFDDVILYNFFQDSTMDPQKWNLLRQIEYSSKYMNTAQYDEMIENQEIDRTHRLHFIQATRRDVIEQEWKDKIAHNKLQYIKDNVERQQKLNILNNRSIQRQKRMDELVTLEQALQSDAVYGMKVKGEEDLFKVIKIDVNQIDYAHNKASQKDYSQLCLELKQLYVAITRPKNRVIIYDENSYSRNLIQEYWEQLGCVEVITTEVLSGMIDQKNATESGINIQDALLRKSDTNQWKQQGLRMMKMRYYQQAMLCFEKAGCEDYMHQAKIFHMADHAKETLEEAQREQIFLDQGIMEYASYSKAEKQAKQVEINNSLRTARREFSQVGEEFFKREQFKQAAKCFFSSLNYSRAAEAYLKIGNKRSAAECFYIMQDYFKASDLFLEINEFIKAIECMDLCEQWGRILEIINFTKGKMSFKSREIYIKRYAPLALEELVSNIGLSKIEVVQKQELKQKKILELIVKEQIKEEEEDEEENQDGSNAEEEGEVEEEEEEEEQEQEEKNDDQKDEKKEKKSILDDANNENEEEEEDSCEQLDLGDLSKEEEEDEEEIVEKPSQSKGNKSKISKQNITKDSIDDIDFSIVDKSKSQMQDVSVIEKSEKASRHDNTSFIEDMSFSESQKDDGNEDLNLSSLTLDFIRSKNQLSDFEHLSEIDPEDEWLKMETGSIADIIQKSRNSGIFSCSEFSSVNMMDMVSTKTQMIKTSADIFIQDEIMQQVIKYMSMFSDNFKAEILKIKSKDALLTSRNEQNDETLTEQGANDLLIDLDNIDINFLYLILDTLEHYNIFRLAIFVCNRYKLTKKVGRYLISIAHKFSFLAIEDASLDFKYINPTPEKQKRVEKTMIANIAIHNLFEVINPEFIRLKEADEVPTENNSLGIEVYRGFLSLGYWKKILFIMDYKRSLNLAYYFSDFNSYKTIFLTFNKKYKNKAACITSIKSGEPDFQCIPFDVPKTEEEIEFAIVALEHLITFQNSKPKLSKSTTHNLSFNTRSQMPGGDGQYEKIPQFPSYFTYNAIFWKYINHKIQKQFARNNEEDRAFFQYVGQCCKNALEILDNNSKFDSSIIKLRVFDVFSFISNLFFQLQFQDKLAQILLQHLEQDDFLNFMQVINRVLNMYKNVSNECGINYLVLRALLSPLKARLNINNSDLLQSIGQSRVNIHKSSRLISHFLSSTKNVQARLEVPQISIRILSFEEFCCKRFGKIHKSHEKDYNIYRRDQHRLQDQLRELIKSGDKKSIQEASYIVNEREDKEILQNYVKEIEFLEKKMKNSFYFLDLDCEFISAPLKDTLEFYKESLYKLAVPIVFRKISTSVKLSGTKTYSIERLFQLSAYNIAFSELIKETDYIMNKKEGYNLLNKTKDYVPPEYKKYKKSNPLYKFFKLEYLKKLEDDNEEEEDEEIQQYLEYEGIKKKTKKISLPLLKKCKRQLSSCLQNTYQGYWEVSLHPYVRNILLKNTLKVIQRDQISISYDLKNAQKYSQLLNLLNHTHYLYNMSAHQHMKKDVKQIMENVYNHRNGMILNYVNNTLNILDKHFDNLEVTEKLHQLEYCAIWATISYLSSKNETFNFHLNQNFLKLLPPLKFSEFTTDQKDDNKISVPARFSLEISVQPIKSLDILVEIFQFINDIFTKQSTQIVQRKIIFTRLISLIFIVLTNLKKIDANLSQEILSLLDVIDAEEQLTKVLDSIDFWEDLIQSRNEKEIEELIPLMITDRLFAFDESYEKGDIVQEIYIENIVMNSVTEKTRQLAVNQQILQDQVTCFKRMQASKLIKSSYIYNKQEIAKTQSRLCKNEQQLILLSRFNNKYQLSNKEIILANEKNSQLFHFLSENENLISDIICNITFNSVFDPLDYHYLLLLLDQADRKQDEYEKTLYNIIKNNDQSQNQLIQKLVHETIKKKEELLNWATIQFSKENEDPQVYFLHNKMSIAVKWAKLGYFSDAKKLVANITDDFKLKEAQSLKFQVKQPQKKIGNKFKKNQQKK